MSFHPVHWVKTAAVLDHLDISEPTLYRWIAAGLPCHRGPTGGRYYFDLVEVDEWLKSRSTEPAPGQVA